MSAFLHKTIGTDAAHPQHNAQQDREVLHSMQSDLRQEKELLATRMCSRLKYIKSVLRGARKTGDSWPLKHAACRYMT